MESGIYRIVCNVTGRTYIGSSLNISYRLYQHEWCLNNKSHANRYLQSAWNKYGQKSFSFERLLVCNEAALNVREQQFIDAYIDYGLFLYNLKPCADSRIDYRFKHSAATLAKMSALKKGRPVSLAHRRKISLARRGVPVPSAQGVPKSAEHRAKIGRANAIALKGKKLSIEHRRKISAGLFAWVQRRRESNNIKKG